MLDTKLDIKNELSICISELFRSTGKDVTTIEEFVTASSLRMKWMSLHDSETLLLLAIKGGLITKKNRFIYSKVSINDIDIPLAYKPSKELLTMIKLSDQKNQVDIFQILLDLAIEHKMDKRSFIKNCNKIQRIVDIDIRVAALIVLRDNDVSVAPCYVDSVYNLVKSD